MVKKKSIIVITFITVITIIIIILLLLWVKQRSPQPPAQEDVAALVARVSRLMVLPQETPTIMTVTDKTQLPNQTFFQNAQNGYKVLLFYQAKKAILYDPEIDKIIEVGPIWLSTSPSPSPAEASAKAGAPTNPTPAATARPSTTTSATDLNSQISSYQQALELLKRQEKTLTNQIAIYDQETELLTQQIQKAKQTIADLKTNLNQQPPNLDKGKPGWLAHLLTSLSGTWIFPAQATTSPLTSEAQEISQLEKTLSDYDKKLVDLKERKAELLALTQNSEEEFQKQLAEAQKELAQIQKAAGLLVAQSSKPVAQGQIIGTVGNTGYSFGKHLHFGLYKIADITGYNYYKDYLDPLTYIRPQHAVWTTGCSNDPTGETTTGSGTLSWPLSTNKIFISQGFGNTCYADIYYQGKPHPAIDIYSQTATEVRAVAAGQAYFCRNCTGDGANGVFIFHPNGLMSLYWHLE